MKHLVHSLCIVRNALRSFTADPVAIAAGGYLRDTFVLGVPAKDIDVFVPGGYWSPELHDYLLSADRTAFVACEYFMDDRVKEALGRKDCLEACASVPQEYAVIYAKAIYHLYIKEPHGELTEDVQYIELIFTDEFDYALALSPFENIVEGAKAILSRFDTNLNQQYAAIGHHKQDVSVHLNCPQYGEVNNDESFSGLRIAKFEDQCHHLDVVRGRRGIPKEPAMPFQPDPNRDIPFN